MENLELNNLIKSKLEALNSKTLNDELSFINKSSAIKIAFLGKFSSGKSSLINGLLGKDYLPMKTNPTTGAITEITPLKEIKKVDYLVKKDFETDSEFTQVPFMDFEDYVYGREYGVAKMHVPEKSIFVENVNFIDTPGLDSLEKSHELITFSYLQEIDGAIICHNVSNGELCERTLSLLENPQLKNNYHHLFIALTQTDKKPLDAVEKIKQKIESQLIDKLKEQGSKVKSIPVVITQARAKLKNESDKTEINPDPEGLKECRDFIENMFLVKKRDLEATRKRKNYYILIDKIKSHLSDLIDKSVLDLSDLNEQADTIKKEKEKLNDVIEKHEKKLRDFEFKLSHDLEIFLNNFIPGFVSANSKEELLEKQVELKAQLESFLEAKIKAELSEINTNMKLLQGFDELVEKVLKSLNIADLVSKLATAALVAWLSAGTGLAKNAAEAGGGAVARKALKESAKVAAKEAVKRSALKSFLLSLGKIANDLNIIDHAATFVAKKYNEKDLKSSFKRAASSISLEVSSHIRTAFDNQVFGPKALELESLEERLTNLRNLKRSRIEEQQNQKSEWQKSLAELNKLTPAK